VIAAEKGDAAKLAIRADIAGQQGFGRADRRLRIADAIGRGSRMIRMTGRLRRYESLN
jgi:hypothetical protein